MSEALERVRETRPRRFRPYPEYKDSGVEWLGEIPLGWQLFPLKRLASIRYGLGEPPPEVADGLPFIRATDVSSGRIAAGEMKKVDPKGVPWDRDPVLRKDDIIVVRSGAYTGDSAIVPLAYDGAIAGYDMFMRIRKAAPRFIAWAMLSRYVLESQIELVRMRAAQPHLNAEELGSVLLMVPSVKEQAAISGFLERETTKIDRLVARKERLIELLQEKRTALITRAVTRGLDPNAPLKDSGVEWLGEIPAHWEVKKLKTVSTLQTGITLGKRYEDRGIEAYPYLRVANVQDGYLDLDDIAEIELPRGEVSRHELQPGDVLMTEGGDFDKLGRGCVWEGQIPGCLHQNHIFAVRPAKEELNSQFLAALLSSGYGRAYFTATSKQSTNLASTNSTKLGNFPIPFPRLSEQEGILRFFGDEAAGIDRMTARVQEAIDRLKEFRTALISAAVTGKIDVREAAG
jgi:type I restriction enzyme S subunit